MKKPSGNVFNIESTYYSNMRTGYYMLCGKRLLQKEADSIVSSFRVFTCFVVASLYFSAHSFSTHNSKRVSLYSYFAFTCHEIGHTELLKFYVNVMEIQSECFLHVEIRNCIYYFSLFACVSCMPINDGNVWNCFSSLPDDIFLCKSFLLCHFTQLKILH